MADELMRDWVQVSWNRRPKVLLRKQAMHVLDAFKGHLMLQVRSVIHAVNSDLVVICRVMTS
jgi:hypothetical protein